MGLAVDKKQLQQLVQCAANETRYVVLNQQPPTDMWLVLVHAPSRRAYCICKVGAILPSLEKAKDLLPLGTILPEGGKKSKVLCIAVVRVLQRRIEIDASVNMQGKFQVPDG